MLKFYFLKLLSKFFSFFNYRHNYSPPFFFKYMKFYRVSPAFLSPGDRAVSNLEKEPVLKDRKLRIFRYNLKIISESD